MEIKNVLQTRAGTYGEYRDVSQISQDIKKVIKNSRNYPLMPAESHDS